MFEFTNRLSRSDFIYHLTILLIGLLHGGYTQQKAPSVGAVVSTGPECAPIGGVMLKRGGSAVDAAIATLFCEGVALPYAMGLGGGFFMNIYIKNTKTVHFLNCRDEAPMKAHRDMFNKSTELATKGGLAVAIPGELKGYWEAHQKFGKLPWKDLIQPSIELGKNGHFVTEFLDAFLRRYRDMLFNSPSLREVFIDPKSNQTYRKGHLLKRSQLGKTLEVIAEQGPDALYNGILTADFVKDIAGFHGIITKEDLKSYKPQWEKSVQTNLLDNITLHTGPLPSSGALLTFMLHVLDTFLIRKKMDTVQNWQRIIETFKYAYAKRTKLGDPNFDSGMDEFVANLTSLSYAGEIRKLIHDDRTYQNPEHYGAQVSIPDDHGTDHVSVLAANGDAVSVTSSINFLFGAGIRSTSTGIILNNGMNDFAIPGVTNIYGVPPSPANFIEPHKRPLSSMCPSIFTDKNGDVVLAIGAAGGTKITTSVALVILRKLLFGETLKASLQAPRSHHQLFPMEIMPELNFSKEILDGLHKIGHKIQEPTVNDGLNFVVAIGSANRRLETGLDPRRSGVITFVTRCRLKV